MKIALYYPWIYLRGGVEKTILELTNRSKHQWTIFTSYFDPKNSFPEFKEKNIIELKRICAKRSYLKVLQAAITILFQKIDLEVYDALWVHSEGLGDFITLRNHKKPVICFCHTPLKVIHDPYMRRNYLKNNLFKAPVFILFSYLFNLMDRLAWRNYYHIFSVSQEVRRRILKAKLAPEQKTEIIYRGVDTKRIIPTWSYQPYFFHPTRVKWWKNVELSIEAFKEFYSKLSDRERFSMVMIKVREIIREQESKNESKY